MSRWSPLVSTGARTSKIQWSTVAPTGLISHAESQWARSTVTGIHQIPLGSIVLTLADVEHRRSTMPTSGDHPFASSACITDFDCGFGINRLHLVSECYYTRRSETPLHRCALVTSIGHPKLNISAYASRCLGVVRARTINGCRISANLGWSVPITGKALGRAGSQSQQVKAGYSTTASSRTRPHAPDIHSTPCILETPLAVCHYRKWVSR